MNKRRSVVVVFLVLLMVLLAACAPKAVPTATPQAPAVAPPAVPSKSVVPVAPTKPEWEVRWERTVDAARSEGQLNFATSAGREPQRALSGTFKDRYGTKVETIGAAAAIIMPKILAERRAGLYLWDVMVGGTSAHITIFKPGGATSPLEPALILPDLTDPEVIKKAWFDGKLPWVDRDRHQIGGELYLEMPLAINTNIVKPGEIQSFDDLLDPKWRGKIILLDPTIPGTMADASLMPMFYEVKGEGWVRKLAAQEPIIVADDRIQIEWLAHGKYPISMPAKPPTLLEFIQAGAPVASVITKDVQTLTVGASGVSLIDKAPHPNAAKVFVNWYLSKEGLTVMSKVRLNQTARLDVPTDFLPPERIRQPGAKYFITAKEELHLKVPDYRSKSKEIFGQFIKK